jgi:hypothetical protein
MAVGERDGATEAGSTFKFDNEEKRFNGRNEER